MARITPIAVLPFLFQLTATIIILVVLISPVPLHFSGVHLLTIQAEPLSVVGASAGNASASTSTGNNGNTYTMPGIGGANASSNNTSPSPPTPINFTSSPDQSRANAVSQAVSAATGVAPPPTPAAASPMPAPAGDSPPPRIRRALRRRHDPLVPSSLRPRELANLTAPAGVNGTGAVLAIGASRVSLSFGPLGSCFVYQNGTRQCTPAKLRPSFNFDGLGSDDVRFQTVGLPATISVVPILLLVGLCTLACGALLQIPGLLVAASPARFGNLLETGPRKRTYLRAQGLFVWCLVATLVMLAGGSLSMRATFSKAQTAFDAANSKLGRVLPPQSTEDGKATDVTLVARIGSGFGMLWMTLALVAVTAFLERRRLRQAQAISQARSDIEAHYGRQVFEKVTMRNLGASKRSKARSDRKGSVGSEDGEDEGVEERTPTSRAPPSFWEKGDVIITPPTPIIAERSRHGHRREHSHHHKRSQSLHHSRSCTGRGDGSSIKRCASPMSAYEYYVGSLSDSGHGDCGGAQRYASRKNSEPAAPFHKGVDYGDAGDAPFSDLRPCSPCSSEHSVGQRQASHAALPRLLTPHDALDQRYPQNHHQHGRGRSGSNLTVMALPERSRSASPAPSYWTHAHPHDRNPDAVAAHVASRDKLYSDGHGADAAFNDDDDDDDDGGRRDGEVALTTPQGAHLPSPSSRFSVGLEELYERKRRIQYQLQLREAMSEEERERRREQESRDMMRWRMQMNARLG